MQSNGSAKLPMMKHNSAGWPQAMNMMHGMMRMLPPGYVCTICKKPGHLKSLCPEANNMELRQANLEKKAPKGIPKSSLITVNSDHKFAMKGADGNYVVSEIDHKAAQIVKRDRLIFLDDDEEDQNSKRLREEEKRESNLAVIPPELRCPYGDHILRDAVLIPCCGHFVCCDLCIRNKISSEGIEAIECPHENCAEIGSLASITPDHEIRKKVNDYLADAKSSLQRNAEKLKSSQTGEVDLFYDLIINDVNTESSCAKSDGNSDFLTLSPTQQINSPIVYDIMDSLTKSFDLDKDDLEESTEASSNADTSSNIGQTGQIVNYQQKQQITKTNNFQRKQRLVQPTLQGSQNSPITGYINSQEFAPANLTTNPVNTFGSNQNFQNNHNNNKLQNIRFPLQKNGYNNSFQQQNAPPNNFMPMQQQQQQQQQQQYTQPPPNLIGNQQFLAPNYPNILGMPMPPTTTTTTTTTTIYPTST
jgi:hypothetical protein